MSPCAFVVLLLSVSVCVTVWLRPCDDCGDSWQIRLDFSSIFLVGSKKKGEKSWTSNRTNDCKQRDTQTQLTSFFLRLAKQRKKKERKQLIYRSEFDVVDRHSVSQTPKRTRMCSFHNFVSFLFFCFSTSFCCGSAFCFCLFFSFPLGTFGAMVDKDQRPEQTHVFLCTI